MEPKALHNMNRRFPSQYMLALLVFDQEILTTDTNTAVNPVAKVVSI
jgi:hypothetical protein